ncbi:hypothetical protein NESM_000451000 [Novymonas esmeraldas]|uniref:Uncharacterized protein n=1 Tax=Novymonas esmeraldas TaxID=1808958 RepID=A0AAW0ENG7_9TRYP
MPYVATGESRDSYITGVRPGGRYGVLHDVEKRRDNLPENVFHFIKDGVQRDERMRRNEEESRARTRLEMFAKVPGQHRGGTRLSGNGGGADAGGGSGVGGATEQSAAMQKLELETQTRERRAALLELYQRDREEWELDLGARGLATRRA